jgi:DNA-binding GntR family transcriptional regulator
MALPSKSETAPAIPTYAALRDILRADILSGKIPAGARLTTASLVERFGFSQMPIREALQALQGEGLVDIQPHKGACVLPLDVRRVRNIYDLRGAVEGMLIRLCVPNLTNAAMAELAGIQEELVRAVHRGDDQAVFTLNLRFHHVMYSRAGNDEALVIYERYASLLGGLRGTYGYSAGRRESMVDEHAEILKALRAQDGQRLEMMARLHVDGARDDLLRRMGAGA